MVVTALCISVLLMLLVAHAQQSYSETSDGRFRIVPSRLQLFEYESVSFTCEGFNASAGWKVENDKKFLKECSNVTKICRIDYTFVSDSGKYWCESGGERSNTVSINVTAGSVILESPVRPVVEGESVTLRCIRKRKSSNLITDFYKDGLLIETKSTGELTMDRVLKSHEGFYKCKMSGAETSPESWMSVRGGSVTPESTVDPGNEDDILKNKDSLKDSDGAHKTDASELPSLSYMMNVIRLTLVVLMFIPLSILILWMRKKKTVSSKAEQIDSVEMIELTSHPDYEKKDVDRDESCEVHSSTVNCWGTTTMTFK